MPELAQVMNEKMEVSSDEVVRIFNCLDVAKDDEVHYTPFIAAMLATRVRFHEDKVRASFEAFDRDGTGYITAESLLQIYSSAGPDSGLLSKDEAMQWISEVDYKGNGQIDYDGFLSALVGERRWSLPQLGDEDDAPQIRVLEDESGNELVRGVSDT